MGVPGLMEELPQLVYEMVAKHQDVEVHLKLFKSRFSGICDNWRIADRLVAAFEMATAYTEAHMLQCILRTLPEIGPVDLESGRSQLMAGIANLHEAMLKAKHHWSPLEAGHNGEAANYCLMVLLISSEMLQSGDVVLAGNTAEALYTPDVAQFFDSLWTKAVEAAAAKTLTAASETPAAP
jgi:hypothetical protein